MQKSLPRMLLLSFTTIFALGGAFSIYLSTTSSSAEDLPASKLGAETPSKETRTRLRPHPLPVRLEHKQTREQRIQTYATRLEEASKKLEKVPTDLSDHPNEPKKTVIRNASDDETIEVTFADGSKSFYPNNEIFDPSDGSFHPKEF